MKSSSKPKKQIKSPPPPPPPQQQQQKQQQRKFIIAKKKKKNTMKDPRTNGESSDFDPKKAAYEALRASQDEFFRKDIPQESKKAEELKSLVMEEALSCVPEPGSGRVKHLVKAFESLLLISNEKEGGRSEGRRGRVINWGLPGLQEPLMMKGLEEEKDVGDEDGSGSVSSLDFVRDSRLYSSLDSGQRFELSANFDFYFICMYGVFNLDVVIKFDRLSLGSRTSSGSQRSRRNVRFDSILQYSVHSGYNCLRY